jgi:hypothetical protein
MSMTFVTTDCPGCGEAEIPLDSVTLRVCEDDDSTRCAIRCTHCGSHFDKPVDDGMSVLLVTFGVHVENWSRPVDVVDGRVVQGPISDEELDAFADALAAVDDVVGAIIQ